jgi:peptidyl-prolyl cis-trans isomerase C
MIQKIFLSTFLFLALSTQWGCTKKASPVTSAPILIVNGEPLQAAEFAKALARQLKKFDALAAKDPSIIRKAKEAVTREFVVSTLLRQYATSKELIVTSAEVDREFDRVRKTYPDDFTFKTALATEGLSIEEWRDRLKKSLLEKKVFNIIEGTEDQQKSLEVKAKKFFEDHRLEFVRPPQAHIQQIVVAKEDDAQRLLKKIRDGSSFADLAKRFSISPDGKQGGDIGYVNRGSVPAFDVAFTLKAGQMSGVVRSNYGFHIIQVLDKREQTRQSFEQVRAHIMTQLAAEAQQLAFNKWLEAEIQKAKIERNDSLLDGLKIHTEDSHK